MRNPWTTGPARARSRAAATVQTRTSASIQASVGAIAPSARFAKSTPANAGRTPAGKKVATATISAMDRSRHDRLRVPVRLDALVEVLEGSERIVVRRRPERAVLAECRRGDVHDRDEAGNPGRIEGGDAPVALAEDSDRIPPLIRLLASCREPEHDRRT